MLADKDHNGFITKDEFQHVIVNNLPKKSVVKSDLQVRTKILLHRGIRVLKPSTFRYQRTGRIWHRSVAHPMQLKTPGNFATRVNEKYGQHFLTSKTGLPTYLSQSLFCFLSVGRSTFISYASIRNS